MSLSKPPALATWMLEHLALGSDDALAGDLLEDFDHRLSAGWYWRQVLMAIFVGFTKEIGRQWRAAVFAFAWIIVSVNALHVVYQTYLTRHMLGWTSDWPQSIIFAMGLEISPLFLLWWFGLALYLLMMRSFTLARFARGVIVSVFCMLLMFGTYLLVRGTVIRHVVAAFPRHTTTWIEFEMIRFIFLTPAFLALLLSLCATLPTTAMRRAARIRNSK